MLESARGDQGKEQGGSCSGKTSSPSQGLVSAAELTQGDFMVAKAPAGSDELG